MSESTIQNPDKVFEDIDKGVAVSAVSLPVGRVVPFDPTTSAVFGRPYRATSYAWTNVSVGGSLNPYAYLASNPEWSEKLKHFSCFRGNAHVRMVCSGSPFHFGRLVVGTVPSSQNATYSPNVGRVTADYYTTAIGIISTPHVLVDPSCTASVELVIPFCYPHPFVNLNGRSSTDTLTSLASVNYYPLTTLSSANAAVAQPVTVSFYVYFTEVELTGSTPSLTIVTAREKRVTEELYKGPVSSVASAIAVRANALSHVPVIGQFASVVGSVSTAVADVAAFLGYSKPSLNAHPVTQIKHLATTSLSNTIGPSSSLKLTYDPLQGLSTDPSLIGKSTEDNMSYAYIARQWGYLGYFNWASTDASGALLQTVLVNPGLVGPVSSATYRVVPPLAHLALTHSNWRGSLEYRVILVSSPMMRGRVSVRHVPYAASTAAPAGFGGVSSQTCILDMESNSVVDISVPWTSDAGLLPVGLGIMNTAGATVTTVANRLVTTFNSNGFLTFEVLAPLISQYSPVTASIIVYVRAGKDFVLLDPNLHVLSANGSAPVILAARDTCVASREAGVPAPLGAAVECQLGACTNTIDHVAELYSGEQVISLRNILKRKELCLNCPMTSTAVGTGWWGYNFFINPPHYADSLGSVPSTATLTSLMTYNWFAPAYLGARGGVRYNAVFFQDQAAGAFSVSDWIKPVVYSYRLPVNSGVSQWPYTNIGGLSTDMSISAIRQISAGVEFHTGQIADIELPDNSTALYRCTTSKNAVVADYASCPMQAAAYQAVRIGMRAIVSLLNYPVYLTAFFSVADDFSFVHYMGPPLISFGVLA